MRVRTFAWSYGEGQVQSLGGMLGPVRFRLPSGRVVSPFHVAPWVDDPAAVELPGILRQLRGEWPCIPFGAERRMPLSGEWAECPATTSRDQSPHGHGANAEWTFGDELSLSIDYPSDSSIARLERRIRPVPDAPALDIDLTVQVRHDVALPIGLHPTFRMPEEGVIVETKGGGVTFPGDVEPGVSILAEGASFDELRRVPLRAGGNADLSRLPLSVATEELVQLTRPEGQVTLAYPSEGFRVSMVWDSSHFPGLIIWVSNRGRSAFPWSGRHQALGLEPVCAAFDLGTTISVRSNPLSTAGHPTARSFRKDEVFLTTLRLKLEAIEEWEK